MFRLDDLLHTVLTFHSRELFIMRVYFKVIGGRTASVNVCENSKICDVKHKLSAELGVSSVQITLVHKGTKLDNNKTIESYSILDDTTVNVMVSKLPVFELKLHENFSSVSGDPDLCLNEFSKNYQEFLNSLNLDQIERLCKHL